MKHAITVRVSKKRDPNVRHSEAGRLKSDVIQKQNPKSKKQATELTKTSGGKTKQSQRETEKPQRRTRRHVNRRRN